MNDLTFSNATDLMHVSRMISKSDIIPKAHQNKEGNVYLILMMSKKLNIDPLTMLNNVDVIQGKPSFSSKFLIALANTSGLLSERISFESHGSVTNIDTYSVTAKATLKNGKEIFYTVSYELAKKEGWTKNQKYQTLTDLMLSYRAAAFLCRLYLPEIGCMLLTKEENEDIEIISKKEPENKTNSNLKLISESSVDTDKIPEEAKKSAQITPPATPEQIFLSQEAPNLKKLITSYYDESNVIRDLSLSDEYQKGLKTEVYNIYKKEFLEKKDPNLEKIFETCIEKLVICLTDNQAEMKYGEHRGV